MEDTKFRVATATEHLWFMDAAKKKLLETVLIFTCIPVFTILVFLLVGMNFLEIFCSAKTMPFLAVLILFGVIAITCGCEKYLCIKNKKYLLASGTITQKVHTRASLLASLVVIDYGFGSMRAPITIAQSLSLKAGQSAYAAEIDSKLPWPYQKKAIFTK